MESQKDGTGLGWGGTSMTASGGGSPSPPPPTMQLGGDPAVPDPIPPRSPQEFLWEKEGSDAPLQLSSDSILIFPFLNKSDSGTYICTATSSMGSVIAKYNLDVSGKAVGSGGGGGRCGALPALAPRPHGLEHPLLHPDRPAPCCAAGWAQSGVAELPLLPPPALAVLCSLSPCPTGLHLPFPALPGLDPGVLLLFSVVLSCSPCSPPALGFSIFQHPSCSGLSLSTPLVLVAPNPILPLRNGCG